MNRLRRATLDDFPFLIELENDSFEESRRVDKKSIKNSLDSKGQEVWILDCDGVSVASTTLFIYSKSIRIYSIAVKEPFRGHSIGKQMMEHIIQRSKELGSAKITLEADAMNLGLIHWYESFGFRGDYEIADFYGPGRPAFRMFLELTQKPKFKKGKPLNLVVVDQVVPWLETIDSIKVVRAEEYFTNEKFTVEKGIRVFNMCSSYSYQSIGYYVSLLASARNQHVIPNVATIKDFSDSKITELIGEEEDDLMQKSLGSIREKEVVLHVFFGITTAKKYSKLGKSLYRLFQAPLLEFYFEKTDRWNLKRVSPLPIVEVDNDESLFEYARSYFTQRRFTVGRFKDYKYDLAILIDPNEKTPPSNRIALGKFKLAAQKNGFYTEFITKDDFQRLNEFDALFIRTTTNVNDYTYQFARYAYAEGLVVIDDPWSILKCSNKLFFAESMKRESVLTPKSIVISKYTETSSITSQLNFPMVLKEPDSSFSLGVFKVNDCVELEKTLSYLFETSELVIAQEFIKSSFDWRIGVLDNKPLFACKYFMAKNHWQILNWKAKKKRDFEGNVETLCVENVPKNVLSTAVKACSVMGDGFYGVDLKEIDGKVYVIEVNDNPNVDYHHEDIVLGDELYSTIMKSLFRRIESQRSHKRTISKEK